MSGAPRRDGPTRRTVLRAAGAGGIAVAAAGCGPPGPAVPVRDVPQVPIRLSTRWSGRPDGPLPATGDEGVPFRLALSDTPDPPTVRSGALVSNFPATSRGGVYVSQELGTRVTRIGASFGFRPGNTSGSVALLAWSGGASPSGHCHMVFTPDRWIAGVLDDATVDEVATEYYRTPVPQDLRPVRVDVTFVGSTVVADLPDGTRRQVADPRFGGGEGIAACWEFYKNTADSADTVFYETWAG